MTCKAEEDIRFMFFINKETAYFFLAGLKNENDAKIIKEAFNKAGYKTEIDPNFHIVSVKYNKKRTDEGHLKTILLKAGYQVQDDGIEAIKRKL